MEYMRITKESVTSVLKFFGKEIDTEGYIIDGKSKIRIVCPYSKEIIKATNFSVLPGTSEIAVFVNNKSYCFSEHKSKEEEI